MSDLLGKIPEKIGFYSDACVSTAARGTVSGKSEPRRRSYLKTQAKHET